MLPGIKTYVVLFAVIFAIAGHNSTWAQTRENLTKKDKDQPVVEAQKCSTASPVFLNYYRHQESYIPAPDQGLKYLSISFHIWNDKNGHGSFQDLPETYEIFSQIMVWINGWHELVGQPSDPVPGASTISDTRMRFILDPGDIYFYSDSALNKSASQKNLNAYVAKNHPERMDALLIHFTNGDGAGAGHSSGTKFQDDNDICAIVTEMRPPPHNGKYSIAQHIFHELAHSFGLHHTYNSESCRTTDIDFLYDVFDSTAEKTCKNSCSICYHNNKCDDPFASATDFCSNNIMTGFGCKTYWTSPLQAGRMHRSSCLYSIRQYIWGYDPTPHKITEDETWDFSYKTYRDIIIKPGATLTLQCELQLIPEAKIIIEPGGKLIVDGGVIKSAKNSVSDWQGIEVTDAGKKKNNVPGELIIQNGGRIEGSKVDGYTMIYKGKGKRTCVVVPFATK
jgi:hypothetical protein